MLLKSPIGAHLCRHLRVHLEQFFQPLGVVLEAAADIDAFQHLVVAVMRGAKVVGHLCGVIEIGDGGGEMRLARQQDVFGSSGQVGALLLRQWGYGEGIPTNCV